RHQPLLLALPVRDDGDLGQGQGRGVGARDASAGPGPARGRPWARHRRPGRRDGQGDRARGRLMARAGLDTGAVVAAAPELADAEGLEAVTLARLAANLGV